ncbi:GNAT family N-acetyltransferase [Klebsiella electrica]|uniref:GNAT family N-acetyltransferase n=1 Tax=Klebsiella electrica TaxID=1259973 RepID=UPI002555E6E6|nr:GNAT family N-acetyltransferase [Klebsiella electrica]WIO40881.1 GNAT family N-acetyltransferase [Klebsiella electrica]
MRLTISVRQATRHDWPALQRLFLLSRCHTFTWLNVTDFRLTDLEKQTEGETIWLAHDPQGELAGFIAVWLPDHFIHHLHVAPARQGCGVGKMLLQALPGWQEHGYRLKCLTRNRNALAFYAASGFITIDEGVSDEGAYRLLVRKGAWPQQAAKKMRPQAHR